MNTVIWILIGLALVAALIGFLWSSFHYSDPGQQIRDAAADDMRRADDGQDQQGPAEGGAGSWSIS